MGGPGQGAGGYALEVRAAVVRGRDPVLFSYTSYGWTSRVAVGRAQSDASQQLDRFAITWCQHLWGYQNKIARPPEMGRGQANTTWVLSWFYCPYMRLMSFRMACNTKYKMSDWGAFGKVQKKAIPTVSPERQTDKCKALKPRVKAANVPKCSQGSQVSIWESGGKVGDGAGQRVMECEMRTENDKE
jgi:hypothetical protein